MQSYRRATMPLNNKPALCTGVRVSWKFADRVRRG